MAKLIKASATLNTERGAYFVEVGSFDTHSDGGEKMEKLFGEINSALTEFVKEMKHQSRCSGTISKYARK